MGAALDTLAERVGIEPEFVDAHGQRRETSPEKKRALLNAMELAAGDEAEASATLEELEKQEWTRALPPCAVVYQGRPASVALHLKAGTGPIRWRLTLENGEQRQGEADPNALERVSGRELGGSAWERRLLPLPSDLPPGYHTLRLDDASDTATTVIVTPGTCWLPGEDDRESSPETSRKAQRCWGIAAQVYLLRSERNWGIGDFTDLRQLVEIVRAQGGDAVGVNPLHGMFPDSPEQCSPYSPLSRYLLNVLNIDVEAIPEFATADAVQAFVGEASFQERLARVRAADMVAYEEVAALKLPVLHLLFNAFEQTATPERKSAFATFARECDPLLRTSCVYAAIREFLTDQDLQNRDCGRWPADLREAAAPGVARFEAENSERVHYQIWLQWVADEQLRGAQEAGAGMAVGIYRDLAVGANPSGAEIWSNPHVMVPTAEVGCPPDILNTAGQNWVLPPFHPQNMRKDAYRGFIALLRANMRHAGGLRIDHAMALQRLYWIPRGGTPRDGGYLRYPTEDLIGIIALESHRNRCLVVGEDLGTVPHGFRQRMADARILSYKVLLLEEEEHGKGFVKGHTYQRLALSTASSHDLPTLRGWWEEIDLLLRARLGFLAPDDVQAAHTKRNADREALVEVFREEGLLDGGWPTTEAFIDAAHRFLARTQAVLFMAQLEDIAGQAEQVNLPASMPDQYPSWSRRAAVSMEALAQDPRLARVAAIAKAERGGMS